MDLEIAYDHVLSEQKDVLKKLKDDLMRLNLPVTVFSTSNAADEFKDELIELNRKGNEISCHGYNHSIKENYHKLPKQEVYTLIKESTLNLENILQNKITSFRGPGFSTSADTQTALMLNGYKCDYSVCSRRIDFMNTAGGNINWLYSPNKPYHPAEGNPYIKGTLPLWVVPLSSIGLPFVSGLLYLFGLNFMKFYFKQLFKESIRTNKPIVYLFHSYEFTSYTGCPNIINEDSGLRAKQKWFHKYYGFDSKIKYENNLKLLDYILSFRETKPFTSIKYAEYLESI